VHLGVKTTEDSPCCEDDAAKHLDQVALFDHRTQCLGHCNCVKFHIRALPISTTASLMAGGAWVASSSSRIICFCSGFRPARSWRRARRYCLVCPWLGTHPVRPWQRGSAVDRRAALPRVPPWWRKTNLVVAHAEASSLLGFGADRDDRARQLVRLLLVTALAGTILPGWSHGYCSKSRCVCTADKSSRLLGLKLPVPDFPEPRAVVIDRPVLAEPNGGCLGVHERDPCFLVVVATVRPRVACSRLAARVRSLQPRDRMRSRWRIHDSVGQESARGPRRASHAEDRD